jgi:hypothetical protein
VTATLTATSNPYLDAYNAALKHQRDHDPHFGLLSWRGTPQPQEYCYGCLTERRPGAVGRRHGVKLTYSWAIPNDEALDAIAARGPIVEIGAGGGYWAGLLRARGVDIVAYDPDPVTGPPSRGGYRAGQTERRWSEVAWSEVRHGDHTAAAYHPDRTLLLVWPSYDLAWTDEVLDHYAGDTVIYVGEGPGGCTGTDRMHAILGGQTYCWHAAEDGCDCTNEQARFQEVAEVAIPQWAGLHDQLTVHERIAR